MRTRVGYAGGAKAEPTYRSLGDHAETFQVEFDPARITYRELVDLFWESHDPLAGSMCSQYAAILFYADAAQEKVARESLAARESTFDGKVRTRLMKLDRFWPAEDDHQKHSLRAIPGLMALVRPFCSDEAALRESPLAAKLNAFAAGDIGMERLRLRCAALGYEVEGGKEPTAVRASREAAAVPR